MSFSFGFGGDDIEDDGEPHNDNDQETLAGEMSRHSISSSPHDSGFHMIEPRKHSLQDLLSSLPSQISYNTLNIPTPTPRPTSTPTATQSSASAPAPAPAQPSSSSTNNSSDQQPPSRTDNRTQVLRRSLFDIRAQLMAEADPSAAHDQAETMLSGLENGDLTSGIYEGGFKTWECALDLASLVATHHHDFLNSTSTQNWDIIELGAGSAVPSLALLRAVLGTLAASGHEPDNGRLKFILCDYNEEVLRLCTAPNVLLNYHRCASGLGLGSGIKFQDDESRLAARQSEVEEGELDIEESGEGFVPDLITDMNARHVSFDFISGGWGDSFLELVSASELEPEPEPEPQHPTDLLVLASETIYSPTSSKIFADILLRLLRRHSRGTARAWVAAKKVYFGVGGGVDEFVRDIESQGGHTRTLLETKDTGVGRVVLEITV